MHQKLNTRAIIFSAGLGTRFKPWTDKHPKALAVVNGKTLLQRNIEYLQEYGIFEVVVNVHHFADQIIAAINENKGWGSKIFISDETDAVLETGGGLLKAKPFLENSDFFVSVNVDVLTNLNIDNLIDFYKQKKALIAFGVSQRKAARNILLDEEMQMCGWQNNVTGDEKIVRSTSFKNPYAYSCVAIYSTKVLELIQQKGKFSVMESFLQLAAEHPVFGYKHSTDSWVDVGRPESVALAEKLFPGSE